ncbi:MAG: peptidase M14 [Luteitalea sp.]|nr:peptidase M14 [Luteitalea sp.]
MTKSPDDQILVWYHLPVKTARRPALLLCALLALASAAGAQVPTPEAHFGFVMGADRQLASAEAIERYFELVAARSDRVRIVDIGATTEGHRTIAAIVSAPENIRNLEQIRATNERLSDPRTLPPDEARRLASTHKTVLAIGASIHASEIGATQAANELLHVLSSSTDPGTLNVLQNVIVIVIPMLNPDGHRLVSEWYQRTKGTAYEGGPMPWLYHRYAGHDINRDAFMMNMAENRNLARFFYASWHPQVFLTMHQMEANGPRFFVPPGTDPIDANYDPLIWRTAALLGGAMALELQREGRSGVMSYAKYDYYWPGFEDSAPLGHNTVCLLTEVASVDVASPISVAPSDLRAGFKGLPDYTPQINFPDPWPGGRWTLRDIVDYNLSAVRGLLFATAAYREPLVLNFYEMGRRAVEAGRRGGPFAFIIPPDQHDPHATARLKDLLMQGGIEIHRALEPFRADGEPYPEGTDIILLSQPYRAYVKTLLERQNYPARRLSANGPPERPYDVAGWTLPQQMGITVLTIERGFEPPAMSRLTDAAIAPATVWGERRPGYWLIEARGNGGAIAVNRLVSAGAAPAWTTSPVQVGGYHYAAGSLVVPYLKAVEPVVAQIARELGLRSDGIKGKPPPNTRPIGRAVIALHKPWVESTDEGWTRWLLEQYEFDVASVTDADIRGGNLRARFDVIVLPGLSPDRLMAGFSAGTVPIEFSGGLGSGGLDALRAFVRAGGTLVCLSQSAGLAIAAFNLPLRDVARDAEDRLFVPGSILKLTVDPAKPLAFGMESTTAAFFAFSSAFEPAPGANAIGGHGRPGGAIDRGLDTIARYGDKDILLSGWLEGEPVIAGRAAVIDAAVGAGRVILLGFPVQHRGQSHATFRLLFNALHSVPRRTPSQTR